MQGQPASGSLRGQEKIRVIVCATRFSPTCNSAVDVAIGLAHNFGARLALVHVLEGPGLTRQSASQLLAQIAERAGELPVDTFVLRGEPGHAIARLALHEHADLVVIGESRPSDALVPISTKEVLERAVSCEVISVSEGETLDEVVHRLSGVPAPTRKCSVCAMPANEVICQSCRDRITADVVEAKRRVQKSAARGL